MARKKPVNPTQAQQVVEKSVYIYQDNHTKIAWIPFLILALYMAVHFIPNLNAIDVMGPQWLYLAILDTLVLVYILSSQEKYSEVIILLLKNPFSKLFFSFFLLAGISIFYSLNKIEAWVCFSRLTTTIIAFFNISIILYTSKGFFKQFAKILSVILLIESIQTFLQYWSIVSDVTLYKAIFSLSGNTGNKNIFAASLVIKIPFVLYCILTSKLLERLFHLVALTLGIAAILLINARAAYVSLILISLAYLAFCMYAYFKTKKADLLIFNISYIILPVICAYLIGQNNLSKSIDVQDYGGNYGSVVGRLQSISLNDNASGYRFKLWDHALQYIKENPIIGCGYGNWKIASIPYEKEFLNDLNVPAHAHNDFLEYTTELGISGGVLYFSLFVCLFIFAVKIWRTKANEVYKLMSFCSLIALAVYAVDAGLNFPNERPVMQIFFSTIAALNVVIYISVSHKDKTKPLFQQKKEKHILLHPLYCLLGLLLIIPTTYTNYLTFISLKAQMRVVSDLKNDPLRLSLSEVKGIFPSIPNLTSSSLPIDAILGRYYSENKQYDKALSLFRNAIPQNPHLYYSEFLMANLFFLTENLDSAKHYADLAYYNRPRANTYYQTLIAVEAKRRDTAAIGKAFRTYTHYRNEIFPWQLYLLGMLNAQQKGSPELLKMADSALNYFKPAPNTQPSADYQLLVKRREEIQNNMNARVAGASSQEDINRATAVYNEAVAAFGKGDYANAAKKFVAALTISPFSYSMFENAGICYYNLKEYKKAIYYFDKVIAMKVTTDGKSEFFKGASLINSGDKANGCSAMQIAVAKKYPGAADILAQFCK